MNENTYLGTQTPYVFSPTHYTRPPQGYKPVYINHIGRHGARYLTNSDGLIRLQETLEDAQIKGALTPAGLTLQKQIARLQEIEKGKYGLLTPSGDQMERGIAKRMYQRFPEVFGKRVDAVSTYVERTKESMDTFLEELGRYTNADQFVATSNGKIDPILRFFDLNKEYLAYKVSGDWHEMVRSYAGRQEVPKRVLSQFFSPAYMGNIKDPLTLATDLYKAYTNQFDVGENVGLGRYFNPWTLKYFWENGNLEAYLEKGPSIVNQDLPTDIAYPLVADFLITSQQALDEGKRSADLRFAHAETIIPFASLLGIPGASMQTDELGYVPCIWKDYEVAPMAANIQWIFYKKRGTDEILVKVLYNEREVKLPIPSVVAPYYRWGDVRKYYLQKLQTLQIPWNEPLIEQVKNFKPPYV
ncbi:MAG: hypothetical protein ACRCW2_14800 [Cellulosilyticaceae bacterium]